MNRPRVLLADDHRIVAEGLERLLAPEFDVVAIAADGQAALDLARALRPEVVVADIGMPKLNGIELTSRLQAETPEIKVVILTMHREVAYARRALDAGAAAYVLKLAATDELVLAIRAALSGRTFITPDLASELLGVGGRAPGAAAHSPLTPRQREILQLLAAGHTAKEAGAVLGISARTVESHKYELMQALGVHTSAELVRYAVRAGLVTP